MEPDVNHEKLTLSIWQFIFSLIGMSVGVAAFTFTTFVTKGELQAKDKADDKQIGLLREDMKEIKQDVKDLLKNSKK